jgi:DNA-binding NtrC family response regulator
MALPGSFPTQASTPEGTTLDRLMSAFLERSTQERGGPPSLKDWMDLTEAWRIVHALRSSRGNRSAAARSLGIGRRTLYTKMEKLGITPSFTVAEWPRL